LFERAVAIEQKVLQDAGVSGDADFTDQAMKGRQYTWSGGETLVELRNRRNEILERHEQSMQRNQAERPNRTLMEVLATSQDEEDDSSGCNVCHL
jgi:hypothetical protein